ncbi:MAG: hypothetical protein J5620_03635 [Alphaproteobacteria bacterium]|nr:hypothetical protein [Alphaproteobacteria bacterium]
MKQFYINGKNVMNRDCDERVKKCPVVDYMRSQAFDIKTSSNNKSRSVLFESSFHVPDWERGTYLVSMASVCAECQSQKQNMAEKTNQKSR